MQKGVGGNVGAGYTFMFSPQWGVNTGVEAAFYKSRCDMDIISGSQPETGNEGDFIFNSEMSHYHEKLQVTCLNIPVMLAFQTGRNVAFYGMAGVKLGIPLSAKYSGGGDLTTSGLFEYEQQEYRNMPERGFGVYRDIESNGTLDAGLNIMPSMELGVKMAFGNGWAMHTGVYADFGVTDIRAGSHNQPLAGYQSNAPAQFKYHSITETEQAGKMNVLSAGVRVRISMGN
ncbi:hypothetical protein FACS189430_02940 [Bacteroidia bacterium]|nr:hypothetical protein FACS189430_02940 [Bacteroidia bacterium]